MESLDVLGRSLCRVTSKDVLHARTEVDADNLNEESLSQEITD